MKMDCQENDAEIMPLNEIARTDIAEDSNNDPFERPPKLDNDVFRSCDLYAVDNTAYHNEIQELTSNYKDQGVMVQLSCSYTNVNKSYIKQTKWKEDTVDNEGPIGGIDNTTDTSDIEQMEQYPAKETEGMIYEYEKSDKQEEILIPEKSETECNVSMLIQGKEDMLYKYEKSDKQEGILIPEKSETECNEAMKIQGKEDIIPRNTPFLRKNSKETVRPQQPRTTNKRSTTKDRLKHIPLIKEVKSQRKMFVNSRKSLNQIVNESKFEARTRDEQVTKTKVKNKHKTSNNKCGGTSRTEEMIYGVRKNSCFRDRKCKGVRYSGISYLLLVLFLVPFTSQTTVKWSFKGFLPSHNDSAILRCSTDNMSGMCDKNVARRWTKGSMQTSLVFNGVSTNKTKYQEVLGDNCTVSFLFVKNLNEDDIHEFYTCAYGFAEETKNFTVDENALRSYTLKDDMIAMKTRYTKGKLLLNLSIKRAYPTPQCNILIENQNISYKTIKRKHGIFVSIDFLAEYQLNADICNGTVNGVCYFMASKMNVHNQTFDYCTEFEVDGEKRNSAGYICLGAALLIVVVIMGLGIYRRVICRRNRMENYERETHYNVLGKSWRELDGNLVNDTLKKSGENHCHA